MTSHVTPIRRQLLVNLLWFLATTASFAFVLFMTVVR
ncbi:hypothetical protein C7441_112151 [Pseudaminobacter salicylatoxidans]|uniref:Uncharacterized protein n=1 Tax=Pseudaminobacter salicylatoxidans TaxID=93369 RepID=A0A316CLF1_PSESE|nr:hypothetical protein C7441_112151 [Pseudaminobacter salicylatoxidans]